jgi:Mg-chelatase subunit ChlD
LIAAADDGLAEFITVHVTDDGRTLAKAGALQACSIPPNLPNDILTANGLLSMPSPTPSATAAATPTITDTPEPSATASASPTSVARTATATSTPTATRTLAPTLAPTSEPRPMFLPLLLHERCVPAQQRLDVVLVLDASSSMLETVPGGATKLDHAVEAAGVFLDLLRLADGDQAAVVEFNDDARLLQGLTSDQAILSDALSRLETAQQTCLPCGLETAVAELASERQRPVHTRAVVLLTDGRSNPRPAGEAVAVAEVAKRDGVVLFTIGLGAELDEAALVAIASRPAYAYRGGAEDLAAIYRTIAVAIPCAPEVRWPRRP